MVINLFIYRSLSERERITLLMMRGWGDNERSYEAVKNLFNDTFPERYPISKSTVIKTVARFVETGSVKDRVRTGRPTTVTGEAASLDVLQSFVENPNESVRSAAETHEMSRESVRKVLKSSFQGVPSTSGSGTERRRLRSAARIL